MAFRRKNYQVHNLPTFRLGLNTQQSPDEIQDEELADCENFSIESDTMATAPGYSTYDDDIETNPGPYWGGVSFYGTDGLLTGDVRQRQDKLEYNEYGGSEWFECTLPTEGSPATTISLEQIPCVFAQLNGILVWTNGTDTVMSSTDGITWVLQEALPICKVIFENGKNRLLYLAQLDKPYRIDWSGINDPLTIGASNFQLLDPNNHGIIIGAALTPDGSTLVFKESGLYSISDYVDDGIIDINFISTAKLSSHQTIQTTENSVIWYGWDYFYEYIGGIVRTISGRISSIGRNNVVTGQKMCSGYDNRRYYCSMPDATVSYEYNSQEYVIYINQPRQDPIQPYAITRNKRYFGCYWKQDTIVDDTVVGERFISLFVGDSRTADQLPSSGSPAVTEDPIFAWVNTFREISTPNNPVDLGLGGYKQPAFFVTKYFTQNVPFYVKKYKKLFLNCKFYDSADIEIGYRFDPFAEFTMAKIPVETSQIDIKYEDGNQGEFAEGYGFSQESIANLFLDLENTEKPRGVQFKVQTNETKDIINFGLAYKFQVKSGKFK